MILIKYIIFILNCSRENILYNIFFLFDDMENKYDTYCCLADYDIPHLLHYNRTMQYRISTLIQSSRNAFSTLIETDAIVTTVFVSDNECAVEWTERDKKQRFDIYWRFVFILFHSW